MTKKDSIFGLENIQFGLFLALVFLVGAFDNRPGANYIQWAFIPFFAVSILRFNQIRFTREYKLIIIFVLWSFFSLVWTVSMDHSTERLQTVFLLGLLFISASTINFTDRLARFDYTLLSFILGTLFIIYLLRDVIGSASLISMISDSERLKEDVANLNAVGKASAIGFLFCVYQIVSRKNRFYFVLLVLFLGIVFLTKSKSALLSTIIAGGFLFYKTFSGKVNKTKTFIVIAIIVGVIYYVISKGLLGDAFVRLINMFNFFTSGDESMDMSTATRADFAFKGLKTFSESPILGYGIGSSYKLLNGTYYHNNYVQLLVETGIVGFVLYYGFLITILIRLFKNKGDDISYLLISFLIVFLFCDVTNTTYYHKINYVFYAIAVSYLNFRNYSYRNKQLTIK